MNNRMKGLLGLIGLGLAISFWMVWGLQPNQYFTTTSFLLLVKPTSSTNQLPNDGSSYTFHLKHLNYAQQ
ncbi:hypothetical protein [Paenibacillus sp. FSL H8-0034]|uniref:hypothetical protein n=1 Tax=Paenibacillus sp. FSL H8-0034 TaxID=2954671 RepID=UPI0030F8DAA5